MEVSATELIVKCMSWYVATCEAATNAWTTLVALWTACTGVFSDQKYVLFDGIPSCAYPLSHVSTWATGSAIPMWMYNASLREFWKWEDVGCPNAKARTLPFLSMEIVHGSRVHYDLTEYISSLRLKGTEPRGPSPTIPELLAAWSTTSQIILHPTRFTVRIITEMGDTETYTVNGERVEEAGAEAESDSSAEASTKDE